MIHCFFVELESCQHEEAYSRHMIGLHVTDCVNTWAQIDTNVVALSVAFAAELGSLVQVKHAAVLVCT